MCGGVEIVGTVLVQVNALAIPVKVVINGQRIDVDLAVAVIIDAIIEDLWRTWITVDVVWLAVLFIGRDALAGSRVAITVIIGEGVLIHVPIAVVVNAVIAEPRGC